MEWLHLTALTLFQPHKRLQQLFLGFLIISDPLRLGCRGHWGQVLMEGYPSTKGVILWKKAPYALPEGWKLEQHNCSGPITLSVASAIQASSRCSVYFQTLCMRYIFWLHFRYPSACTALLSNSWLGRWFSWSIWLSLVYSAQCFRRSCCVQGRNKKAARKYK